MKIKRDWVAQNCGHCVLQTFDNNSVNNEIDDIELVERLLKNADTRNAAELLLRIMEPDQQLRFATDSLDYRLKEVLDVPNDWCYETERLKKHLVDQQRQDLQIYLRWYESAMDTNDQHTKTMHLASIVFWCADTRRVKSEIICLEARRRRAQKVKFPVTAEIFKILTGALPNNDDLERVNCTLVGHVGHSQCGWCTEHSRPRFHCTTECIVTNPVFADDAQGGKLPGHRDDSVDQSPVDLAPGVYRVKMGDVSIDYSTGKSYATLTVVDRDGKVQAAEPYVIRGVITGSFTSEECNVQSVPKDDDDYDGDYYDIDSFSGGEYLFEMMLLERVKQYKAKEKKTLIEWRNTIDRYRRIFKSHGVVHYRHGIKYSQYSKRHHTVITVELPDGVYLGSFGFDFEEAAEMMLAKLERRSR